MDSDDRKGDDRQVMCHASPGPVETGGHLVVFYEHDDDLTSKVGHFFSQGLEAGDAVLVVATGPHRRAIRSTVVADQQTLARVGELEAATTLQRLTGTNGRIERRRFLDVMQPTLATVARSASSGRVRVYGEMVALLTDGGDPDGAIALEELWNELGSVTEPFTLLCGYPQSQIASDEHFFGRVRNTHTAVLDGNAA